MQPAVIRREPGTGPTDASLEAAYAMCSHIARTHYENFPVASWLLPRHMRPHVAALYAFARKADDFADEGDRPAADRFRDLDDWLRRLRLAGDEEPGTKDETAHEDDQIFLALGHTIRSCRLPIGLFEDLLSAFRQDVEVRRYATWEDVMDYSRRSANPVGRLVLRIGGYVDSELDRASDALCTALQLTNFWQDLLRDWERGRLYLPLSELEACGATEQTIGHDPMTPEWRRALEHATARTWELFAAGRRVADGVEPRLAFELRLTWLGGTTILDRLERSGFDLIRQRPTLRARDAVPLAARALLWRAV